MSDIQEAAAPAEIAPNEGIVVPGEATPATPSQSTDTESRARAMGWVPKEEFRGPEDKWRSAEEFVERGENELPILRERSRDLARKVAELESKFGSQEQTYKQHIAAVERMSVVALQRQREQLIDQYNHAMRSAVELGDVSRYDQLNRDREQAIYNFDQQVRQQVAPAPAKQSPQQSDLPPEQKAAVETWISKNPWFTADPVLNIQAQAEHMRIQAETPGLSISENLERTRQAIMQRFPAKFGIAQQSTAAVESGSRMPAGTRRQKSASDLPADVRRVADGFVKQGLFKDANEYARIYFEEA